MANEDIPINADHWLFAEDLTNFVFRHHAGFPRNQIREECQDFVHEGFSEIVRSAVAVIESSLTQEIESMFSEISLKTNVVEEYKNYACDLRKSCGSNGFDANKFLRYCVHITCLGERFYRTGIEDFHYLAFKSVREALKRYDMSNGGWNTLDLVADMITSVEEHFDNLPSPEHETSNYEQSILNANVEPEYVNRTWNLLNEHSSSSSECSTNGSSSNVKDEFSHSEESGQSLDADGYPEICKESDATSEADSESLSFDDSSSRWTVSLRKVPTQSNVISSSTPVSEFRTEKDNSFLADGIYSEQNAPVSDSLRVFQKFPDEKSLKPLDLFISSDQNETRGISELHEARSERLNPYHVTQKSDENSIAASKEVIIPSENSRVVKSPQRTNGNSQHLLHHHNSDQSLKIRSTAKKTARNRRFSVDAHASNSTVNKSGTRSVFPRSDRNESISKCTLGSSDINPEVEKSEVLYTNPRSNCLFRDTEHFQGSKESK